MAGDGGKLKTGKEAGCAAQWWGARPGTKEERLHRSVRQGRPGARNEGWLHL